MSRAVLRWHSFVPASRANGPGWRAVLWLQGCSLGCPGCFNPETHPLGGREASPEEVLAWLLRLGPHIEGLTLTGGEPFEQRSPLLALLRLVRRETNLSVVAFTGFSLVELCEFHETAELLSLIDVLLAGRYDPRGNGNSWREVSHKTIYFQSVRYSSADLESVPEAEAIVNPDGWVTISGIDPPAW